MIQSVLSRSSSFSTKTLCCVASVSKSGFYYHLNNKDNKDIIDYKSYLLIKMVFNRKKERIGARGIKMDLENVGIVMNLKKIHRIMNKYSLVCTVRTINKARVSLQRNKENIAVDNVLNRQFNQKTPYTFTSTDITYLKHKDRFSFLSVIKDLATGEIVSWRLSKVMNLDLVLNTIDDLEKYFKTNNLNLSSLLVHSDQGFQYTNRLYHQKLKELNITQSMSRRGNSVDNAPIESFFGHMKDEVDYKDLDFVQLRDLIDEYMIEYNYKRKQWGRRRLAPVFYRNYLLGLRCNCVQF